MAAFLLFEEAAARPRTMHGCVGFGVSAAVDTETDEPWMLMGRRDHLRFFLQLQIIYIDQECTTFHSDYTMMRKPGISEDEEI